MPVTLGWPEILLRLALTVVAGALVGFNRGERGRSAGLRTTLLVCLAASLSMIEVNLLLGTTGKASNSFVVLDLMRLPLGILSGMGFIGAGAIIRRGNMVHGVTTAATLWFVTVLGLCFGGGQIAVGLLALSLGLFVLWCLKWLENRMNEDRVAQLLLTVDGPGPSDEDVRRALADNHYEVTPSNVVYLEGGESRETTYQVKWRARRDLSPEPAALPALAQVRGVRRLEWRPE